MSLRVHLPAPKSMPGLWLDYGWIVSGLWMVYDRVLGLVAGMLFGRLMVNAW